MNVRRFVLMLALAGVGWSAFATTRYVSLLGDDETGDGTQAKPWKTIQKALDSSLSWNSTIWVSNGVYKLDSQLVPKSNGVWIRSYTGNPADVVLDGQGKCRCYYGQGSGMYSQYFRGITFANGKATGTGSAGRGGGAWVSSIGQIIDCVFTNCEAQTGGGGLFATDLTYLRNIVVADCRAGGDGGGIFTYLGHNPYDNIYITNCIAGGEGGGFYVSGDGGPAIYNFTVVDCHAQDGYGGGIRAYAKNIAGGTPSTNVVIRNCTASRAGYVGGGGADLYYFNCSDWTVTDCQVIQKLTATSPRGETFGGGLRLYNSTISNSVVTGCGIFSEHPSQYNEWEAGGGIYNRYDSSKTCNVKPFIVDCIVRDCYVTNGCTTVGRAHSGGGVAVSGSDTRVERCDISCNRSMYEGGGLCVTGSRVDIRNCTVTNNVCYGPQPGYGGGGSGIWAIGGNATIDNCLVQSNSFAYNTTCYCYFGSAVQLGSNGKLLNSVIAGNKGAKSVCVSWFSSGGHLVSNCLFRGNRATGLGNTNRGGMIAVYGQYGKSLVTDCRFLDGESLGDCGGFLSVAMDTTTEGEFRLRNCLVSRIKCKDSTCSLCWSNAGPTANGRVKLAFENCTFVGNTPTRYVIEPYYENAKYYWGREQTTVTGCAILFNNGMRAFAPGYDTHPNISYSCAEIIGSGVGNVVYNSSKPAFEDWENGNVRPARRSQLIDGVPPLDWMGDGMRWSKQDLGTGYAVTLLDPYGATVEWQETNPRLCGTLADIGCCEFHPQTGLMILFR